LLPSTSQKQVLSPTLLDGEYYVTYIVQQSVVINTNV